MFLHVDSEDSDKTELMPRLISLVMHWFIYIAGEVVFYNIFYEVFTVCTSLVAQNTSGKVMILTRLSVS